MSNNDPERVTSQSYDRFSEYYAGLHSSTDEMGEQLESFISLLSGRRILDVGCGNGRDMKYLASRGLDVWGLDLSKRLLQFAKRDRLEVALMDMRGIGFLGHAFDALWVCASLLHVPKHDVLDALSEFHRVLKADGTIYISVKEGEGEKFVEERQGFKRFFSFYKQSEFETLLGKAHFEVVKSQAESKNGQTWLNILVHPEQ